MIVLLAVAALCFMIVATGLYILHLERRIDTLEQTVMELNDDLNMVSKTMINQRQILKG